MRLDFDLGQVVDGGKLLGYFRVVHESNSIGPVGFVYKENALIRKCVESQKKKGRRVLLSRGLDGCSWRMIRRLALLFPGYYARGGMMLPSVQSSASRNRSQRLSGVAIIHSIKFR